MAGHVDLVARAQDLDEQLVLAVEVVQQSCLAEADRLGELLHGGPVVALAGDHGEGCAQDLLALRNALRVRTSSCHVPRLSRDPDPRHQKPSNACFLSRNLIDWACPSPESRPRRSRHDNAPRPPVRAQHRGEGVADQRQGLLDAEAIDRIGVPSIMVTDGPHGLRKQAAGATTSVSAASVPATCFPPARPRIRFDPELAERVGVALGVESAIEDVAVILGPGINIKRSPLCGATSSTSRGPDRLGRHRAGS
jgi:hypothetical protein